jgi:hypothetical protein
MEEAQSLSELKERDTALEDAKAKELLETEEILSASADSRLRSDRLDGAGAGAPPKYYDQTKLDGKTNHASVLVSFFSFLTYLVSTERHRNLAAFWLASW